jgi:hypothetical protein
MYDSIQLMHFYLKLLSNMPFLHLKALQGFRRCRELVPNQFVKEGVGGHNSIGLPYRLLRITSSY